MADNLEQQGGTWHVRKSIPKDVRKEFGGRKILSKSLETGLRSEAMKRRLPYLTQWTAEIAAARLQAKAAKEDWRPDLAMLAGELDARIGAKLISASKGTLTFGELEPDEREVSKQMLLNELRLAIKDPETVQDFLALLEKATNAGSALDKVQGMADFMRAATAHICTSDYDLSPTEMTEAKAIVRDPTVYKPKSPITTARIEAFRKYREARAISAKNIDAQESKLEKLSAFLATSGKPLDFDCVSAWLDSITAASKTKTQYLNAGNTFWKWAMQNDARWKEDYKGVITPFERHDLPQLKGRAKKDAQRVAFEGSEITTLYAAAQDKKLHALADLILLGAYTGARIEELCQLRTENVIEDEGVQSFDIVDSKTVAGIRVVPVHPALAELVKRLMKDTKDGYLIPSKANNKYGIRSDLMSKAFGRIKKDLGFDRFHVFHSIRMTAITQLVRASVAGTIIAELVGHETGTVTYDVYSQGHSAAQKLEAISKLPTLPNR
ncbi:tyrosine-type recombinase/integrase [Pseudomonas sp. IT-P218]|uniref:tyrosine-type recombinase/integrase n=1 Tax=Pseudomonas sp. IT-P218 TaxID=3026449 RepID=UPI0039DF2F76